MKIVDRGVMPLSISSRSLDGDDFEHLSGLV